MVLAAARGASPLIGDALTDTAPFLAKLDESRLMAGLFGLSLFMQLAFFALNRVVFHLGPLSPDSHLYLGVADAIHRTGWAGLQQAHLAFYYWLYPLVLAGFMTLFGTHLVPAVLGFQILLVSAVMPCLYRIGARAFGPRVGLGAAILGALTWETSRWNGFVLTDSLYLVLLVVATDRLLALLTETGWRAGIGFGAACALLTILRPTGGVFVLVGLGFVARHWLRTGRRRWVFAGGAIALALALAIAPSALGGGSRLGLGFYRDYYAGNLAMGEVIHGMPEYYLPDRGAPGGGLIRHLPHDAELFARRMAAFWAPVLRRYSPGHKLINGVTLAPLFVLALGGCWRVWRERPGAGGAFLVVVLGAYTVFHAATEVDFDHRYRTPLVPLVCLLASYGSAGLIRDLRAASRRVPA